MTVNKKISLTILRCLLCAYEWIPRKLTRPVECPKCKRRDWDVKK